MNTFTKWSILIPLVIGLVFFATGLTTLVGASLLALLAAAILAAAALLMTVLQNKRWMVMISSMFIPGAVPVEMVDFEGDIYYAIARRKDDGTLVAHAYWFTRLGKCILRGDGRIDDSSEICYMCFWLPLEARSRVFHIMVNDLPDFSGLALYDRTQRRDFMRRIRNG